MTDFYNLTLCFGYSPIKNTISLDQNFCHQITWIIA